MVCVCWGFFSVVFWAHFSSLVIFKNLTLAAQEVCVYFFSVHFVIFSHFCSHITLRLRVPAVRTHLTDSKLAAGVHEAVCVHTKSNQSRRLIPVWSRLLKMNFRFSFHYRPCPSLTFDCIFSESKWGKTIKQNSPH